MDVKEAARLVTEQLNNMSDEEFIKLYFEAQGENYRRSNRYFELNNLCDQVRNIKDMEYYLEVLQEEINKAKEQLKVSQQKLKQSFNCQ